MTCDVLRPSELDYLLLALLFQVQLHFQRLSGLQKSLSVLPVSHVVGHDTHGDGTNVDEGVGQELETDEDDRT